MKDISRGDNFESVRAMYLRPSDFQFWRNSLIDSDTDINLHANTAVFDISNTAEGRERLISRVSIVEAPKIGARQSADIALIKRLANGDIFLFTGDGVRFMSEPPKQIRSLLNKFDCEDRPDALPARILTDPDFNTKLFFELGQKIYADNRDIYSNYPERFFHHYESQLNHYYKAHGVNLDSLRNSQLPSMSGIATIITPTRVITYSVGDPESIYLDTENSVQRIQPRKNLGIDAMTRRKVNKMLSEGKADSVTEALATNEFKRWIIRLFDEKINKKGGVALINGKDLSHGELVMTSIPLNWFKSLTIGSDGLSLGLKDELNGMMEFGQLSSSSKDLLTYAKLRLAQQVAGFREDTCTQDRVSDDFVGVHVDFNNPFDESVIGKLLSRH